MLNRGARAVGRIDARTHLASLAGQTLLAPADGSPIRILGVTRDTIYVMTHGSPLGAEIPVTEVQAAFDRLVAGEDVEVSIASLGDRAALLGAAMLSLPGAEELADPLRVRRTS
jgi:hypothetical protein